MDLNLISVFSITSKAFNMNDFEYKYHVLIAEYFSCIINQNLRFMSSLLRFGIVNSNIFRHEYLSDFCHYFFNNISFKKALSI